MLMPNLHASSGALDATLRALEMGASATKTVSTLRNGQSKAWISFLPIFSHLLSQRKAIPLRGSWLSHVVVSLAGEQPPERGLQAGMLFLPYLHFWLQTFDRALQQIDISVP